MKTVTILWALLFAAPVFSQPGLWSDPRPSTDGFKWFQLNESATEVRKLLGQPAMVADAGEYSSWQYQIGAVEHDDFSHVLVFRKSDGKLVSITRSYNPERNVDAFFPADQTTVQWFHTAGQSDFPMRVRRLAGGRVLIAVGTSAPGQVTGQLVLMLESEARRVYPWMELATR
jgi:hypothetical protein